jgi:hypothetical protein
MVCVRGTWGDLPQAGTDAAPLALDRTIEPRVSVIAIPFEFEKPPLKTV